MRLKIGGPAKLVIVRLLSKGQDPNDPSGIEGGTLRVTGSGPLEITLQSDHASVTQISVHGGSNLFNLYSLGGGNGAATLQGAEFCAK